MDRRTRARELAMQGLYQLDVQGSDVLDFLGEFFAESDADENIVKQAVEWTKGTWENLPRCDELIITSTIKWQFARLSPVDRESKIPECSDGGLCCCTIGGGVSACAMGSPSRP